MRKWIVVLLLFCPVVAGAQSGWKTIKDRTGACQMSVPPNWTLLSDPGTANWPDRTTTRVRVGLSPFKPYSDMTLKMFPVETLFENSAKRSFWVTKPSNGSPSLVTYHVETPGSGSRCVAEIYLPPQHFVEEAKKIAMSLASAQ
jgi:hypothetical protein